MSKRNWDQIADEEFNAMDQSYQADWADLRKRSSRG